MNDTRKQFGGSVAQTGSVAIDQGLREYMLGVYNYMALAVAGTGLFSMFIASNQTLMIQIMTSPLKWVGFIGILGIGNLGAFKYLIGHPVEGKRLKQFIITSPNSCLYIQFTFYNRQVQKSIGSYSIYSYTA